MQAFKLDEQAAISPATVEPPMEHRFGRRYSCGAPVQISSGSGAWGDGRLLNVSMSGAHVQTALHLPPFSLVSLTKRCGDTTVELRASVVRQDAGGIGVEWCETPTRSICQLL